MGYPEQRISVSNGKYTFVIPADDYRVHVLRYDEPWIADLNGPKALHSMMCELDAARVVVEAARNLLQHHAATGRMDEVLGLESAMKTHRGLVDDLQRPTVWARPYCHCGGAHGGGHEPNCDRT